MSSPGVSPHINGKHLRFRAIEDCINNNKVPSMAIRDSGDHMWHLESVEPPTFVDAECGLKAGHDQRDGVNREQSDMGAR